MTQAMMAIAATSQQAVNRVKVTDEIGFQTNIVALNAVVKATRAGPAGAGFAVVADEVRSLALRSSAAAHAFTSAMSVSISNGCDGALRLQLVNPPVYKIQEKVNGTDALVAERALAATAQAGGVSILRRHEVT
ncbi:MAG: methyl-accepting chemotaxis protein [Burkholderiaceae bacterium]|jgi:methyl-accepting chemotaxis protein